MSDLHPVVFCFLDDVFGATLQIRGCSIRAFRLRSLQLSCFSPPHHMISSKTGAGVELLRARLASVLPSTLLARSTAKFEKATATQAGGVQTSQLEHVETAAAKRFAAKVAARGLSSHPNASDPTLSQRHYGPSTGKHHTITEARNSYLQRRMRRRRR